MKHGMLVDSGALVLAMVMTWTTIGCTYRVDKRPQNGEVSDTGPVEKARLSYRYVNERVLVPRCIACHGSAGGVNLESYSVVKARIGEIQRVALQDRTMPKGQPLSEEEARLLAGWIAVGAPENVNEVGPVVPVDPLPTPSPSPFPTPIVLPSPTPLPLEPRFESIKAQVFVPRCMICHSPTGSGHRILLNTIDDLVNSPLDLVIPADPDESGLIIAIERQDEKRMPPPSSAVPALSDDEKAIIRKWIENGAKDE